MIRDPSDGTVREAPKAETENPIKPYYDSPEAAARAEKFYRVVPGPDTGVRQPTKTDAMMRLEFSREWLKNYHAKKETEHARGSNGTEHSTDGRSGNDQGQAESGLRADG